MVEEEQQQEENFMGKEEEEEEEEFRRRGHWPLRRYQAVLKTLLLLLSTHSLSLSVLERLHSFKNDQVYLPQGGEKRMARILFLLLPPHCQPLLLARGYTRGRGTL